jgi:hypothetical protein
MGGKTFAKELFPYLDWFYIRGWIGRLPPLIVETT